eukprot:TRINITY_DN3711_c0_g1_i1.p2 TRINITY_DN3711_c0_g1~~TRINITY_DN3711_c0_g1_i1.p2  ORF type:complete len:148 (+),score=27.71 TRINITY_DN3711_c0_g1_i1:456-899(+)
MKFGFSIYDEDKDGVVSKKDLYTPFVTWSRELYKDVFVNDLTKMAHSSELTFGDFLNAFDKEYPLILQDILLRVMRYEVSVKRVVLKELQVLNRMFESACRIVGDKAKAEKVIKVFKKLAVNTEKPSMHLTFDSLAKGFVTWLANNE